MAAMDLIATATFGLEAVVAEELHALGYMETRIEEGGRVNFRAEAMAIARANLWLRAADRVLVKVGGFPARTFTELFEGTKALPWAEWLPADACFPVAGKCVRSQLMSVPDCQSIVKKAIVESLKARHGGDWLPETGATYKIEISLLKDWASLTLDTSGPGLHKRGYRPLTAPAPLKETLAAGLILLAHWRPEEAFLDPCCGSGTLPIEAALLGYNIAPGIRRAFAAESWPTLPAGIWVEARAEAADLAMPGRKLSIRGSDIDTEAIRLAEFHAGQAGVAREIGFAVADIAGLSLGAERGWLVANPPYGERLGEQTEVEALYRQLGAAARANPSWSFNVITAHPGFERLFGRRADRRRKLYNGRLECQYYQYREGLGKREKGKGNRQ